MRVLLLLLLVSSFAVHAARPAIAIHGGAGTLERDQISPELERALRADLEAAVRRGYAVLLRGGSSLDAVVTAVSALEDSSRFNAGRGAVFNSDGINELDAAVMDGARRRAGAIAGVRRIKNPIVLARAVMDKTPHVLLTGKGAELFAQSIGMRLVDPSYFHTDARWQQLREAKRLERLLPRAALPAKSYFGTVGAVALDREGRIAAATSTGGMTNKRWGRVGDAPLIGAGTYADSACAVSATGHGEFFIRSVVAYDICARAKYRGSTVKQAAEAVIQDELRTLGGSGGVITIDSEGRIAMPFNTEGMYRAAIDVDGRVQIDIF